MLKTIDFQHNSMPFNVELYRFLLPRVEVAVRSPLVKKENPKPYRSPLWPHLEQIRSWRRGRDTWKEIRQKLLNEYKIDTSVQGVQAFFKRAGSVRDPMGFEIERPQQQPSQQPAPPPSSEPTSGRRKSSKRNHTYEEWVKTQREKEKTKSSEPFKTYE